MIRKTMVHKNGEKNQSGLLFSSEVIPLCYAIPFVQSACSIVHAARAPLS